MKAGHHCRPQARDLDATSHRGGNEGGIGGQVVDDVGTGSEAVPGSSWPNGKSGSCTDQLGNWKLGHPAFGPPTLGDARAFEHDVRSASFRLSIWLPSANLAPPTISVSAVLDRHGFPVCFPYARGDLSAAGGGCTRLSPGVCRQFAAAGLAAGSPPQDHNDCETRHVDCDSRVPTTQYDVEDVEYLRHGDKPLLARASAYRAAPDRFRRWSSAMAAPECMSDRDRAAAPRVHGLARCRVRRVRFPAQTRDPYRAWYGYQLRGALDQAQRRRSSRPGPTWSVCREQSGQRASGDAGGHAPARPAPPRSRLPPGSPVHDATVRCVIMWPVINPR